MKKYIISFILGAIIFSGITALAYNLNASETSFTPSDNTWNVTTVSDALNDLYSKTGTISFNNMTSTQIYRKASYSGAGTIITISNVSDYKYYYVTDVYSGGACTTESGCNSVLALTFSNANYVDLGLSYRLDTVKSASRSFFLIPTTGEDIQITVSAGIDGIAVYGIN